MSATEGTTEREPATPWKHHPGDARRTATSDVTPYGGPPLADGARAGDRPRIAIVHDYVTQRGGAERVVLTLLDAFPGAPLYTSLYDPEGTFPQFANYDVRVLPIDRFRVMRRKHRLALPFLARAFSRLEIDADVVLCSSSGWAHAVRTPGRKVVYCYNPARWLYQGDQYFHGIKGRIARVALSPLLSRLRRWDRRAARTADAYFTSSRIVQRRIRASYGINAEILPPPHTIEIDGASEPVIGLEPGFLLSVCRLMSYKNIDTVVAAATRFPEREFVIVGRGPEEARLREMAPANVALLGTVSDSELRWLYANCWALVAASYEDFGLTPLEAAAFGSPTIALRYGGYLDTMVEGKTAVFFDRPTVDSLCAAIRRADAVDWSADTISRHAEKFDERRFIARLCTVVEEAAAMGRPSP